MTIIEILKSSSQKYKQKTALVFCEQEINYAELYSMSLKVASGLQSVGINPGDHVALLLKNCPEFIYTIFALSHIGACAIPINFYLKPEEIAFICSDSRTCGLVTQSAFLPTVRSVQEKYGGLNNIWITDVKNDFQDPQHKPYAQLTENKSAETNSNASGETTVLILYTSGTTGKSKGVMLTENNLTSNALAAIQALDLNSTDRFICILPMFHVFAWTANILVPLYLGCPIVIVESIRPPKLWLSLMNKHKITIFAAVPQIYALLAEQAKGLKKWVLKYLYFSKVRFAISGAAPLQVETMKKFEDEFGIPLLQGYGLTETSPVATVNTLSMKKDGTVGKPIPDVKIKIIDENENALSSDQEGEICIKGPNIMKGYYGQDQSTKEAFTKDGWFKTGDVGVIDSEGFLRIQDRIKDMIIVKGLKVFSVQIEEILLNHPAVAEAAVVGIPDDSGNETIKGFVILKSGFNIDKLELMKLCQEKLPPYKRPRDIEIRKELPKNALQKILKKDLRKQG